MIHKITQRTISLPENFWDEIDKKRGDVNRSRFVARILADSIVISGNNVAKQIGDQIQ